LCFARQALVHFGVVAHERLVARAVVLDGRAGGRMRSSTACPLSAQSGEEGGRDAGPAGRQSRGLERRSGLDRRCPACRPFTGRFLGRVLRDAPSREWSRRAGLSRASPAMVRLTALQRTVSKPCASLRGPSGASGRQSGWRGRFLRRARGARWSSRRPTRDDAAAAAGGAR